MDDEIFDELLEMADPPPAVDELGRVLAELVADGRVRTYWAVYGGRGTVKLTTWWSVGAPAARSGR